jgi:lipopolysaccharide/colanic/teichoic acid biosynthesis glycosyltransferase
MTSLLRGASLTRENNPYSNHDSDQFLSPELFLRMLQLERKRSERSGRAFVLMLLKSTKLLRSGNPHTLNKVMSTLASSTRDTDTKGWYQERTTIGVIFTELGLNADAKSVSDALLSKVTKALSSSLSINEINEIRLCFRIFPEDWGGGGSLDEVESAFYQELFQENTQKRLSKVVKRSIDVIGSLAALILGLPVFAAIALALKLTSRGPVLFRQERLGQYGEKFQFLKFRSMYMACDDSVHREYMKRLIMNANGSNQSHGAQAQYKLVDDRRVTQIGRFLRRSSLDELPQFLNVLKGEMSLVGPRPPISYEVGHYHAWHKARLLASKPGITGLWQVMGRSRVKFDDMVRMDLRYAKTWSNWSDIKILLQTPRAVFSGNGAH